MQYKKSTKSTNCQSRVDDKKFSLTTILLQKMMKYTVVLLFVLCSIALQKCTMGSTSLQVSENNGSSVFVELLRGRDGLPGVQGPAGPPGPQGPPGLLSGGAVYTRWGKSSCPSTAGTEMVYSGITAGAKYNAHGGGANHLCMPQEREYSDELTYRSGVNGYAYIWGTQYVGIIGVTNQHTIPCAVCYVPARPTVLMIPGKASCHPTWTREYFGYLMSEHTGENRHRSMYECVDKDLQSLSLSPNYGSALYAVEADCSSGLSCPPNTNSKELNCVVCTK